MTSGAADEPSSKPSRSILLPAIFAIGLMGGLLLGLALSWTLGPIPQRNTEPSQLRQADRQRYMLAIAMEYAYRRDLSNALDKLIALRPAQDPLEALAEAACELARDGYAGRQGGMEALRMAADLYRAQGRSGCAEELLPLDELAATPTPLAAEDSSPVATPAPSKTPVARSAAVREFAREISTPVPLREFTPLPARTFCDINRPALIEVYTVDYLGRPVPGQRVRVRFGENQDIFLTGLKPDRGAAYADFQMREDIAYVIDMPGAADALGAQLRTRVCYTVSGRESLTSFRVTFREN